MLIEGKGHIAPKPVRVRVNLERGICEADRRKKFQKYETRSTYWGRGLDDQAVLAGILGELAFCNLLSSQLKRNIKFNDELLAGGDPGWDYEIYGVKLEVKTEICRTKPKPVLLLRRQSETGRLYRFFWDYVVSCRWVPGDSFVEVLGYCSRKLALNHGVLALARKGAHTNLEVPYAIFSSAKNLQYEIRSLRYARG